MSYEAMDAIHTIETMNTVKAVSTERLAGRYSYLEREGLLPLPVQGGVTLVIELRHAQWSAECLRLLLRHSGSSVRLIAVPMTADFRCNGCQSSSRGAESGISPLCRREL
jgi:hypothetical protein